MNRKAKILFKETWAGVLSETDSGYMFEYLSDYLESDSAMAISLTLPLQKEAFTSNTLFPFFDGLIPEGWLLDLANKHWKLNIRDRMGLLLACCNDCIGAVSIKPFNENE
ncbi:phosphatidylinositol kinase [Puteibacter caeruleilacunae]|nr:phosphatidylinositol kinase [Puteibacter caeruleilacunae]